MSRSSLELKNIELTKQCVNLNSESMSKRLWNASCINRFFELTGKCVLKKILFRVLMNARIIMMKVNTEPAVVLKKKLFAELHVENKAE